VSRPPDDIGRCHHNELGAKMPSKYIGQVDGLHSIARPAEMQQDESRPGSPTYHKDRQTELHNSTPTAAHSEPGGCNSTAHTMEWYCTCNIADTCVVYTTHLHLQHLTPHIPAGPSCKVSSAPAPHKHLCASSQVLDGFVFCSRHIFILFRMQKRFNYYFYSIVLHNTHLCVT
jgi:hypothetical protein